MRSTDKNVNNVNMKDELNSALQLHRAGQLDAAAEIYRRVHRDNRNDADACYGLGTVLLHQRNYSEAAELLGQALKLEPDVTEFVFNHACALEQLGRKQEAIRGFLRAAELAAADEVMLPMICNTLVDNGLADAALHFLSAIPAADTPALTARAKAQSAIGDFGGAAQSLRHASELEPDNAAVWRGLADANGRQRDYPAAIEAYETYMRLKTPDAIDLLAHADLLLLARQPEAAREAVGRAMEAGADLSAAHLLAANCARLDGDYENTRRHLKTAIEKRPAFGDAWQILLETETEESLPQFAAECARLAADEAAQTRDRIMLSMTAGRAFERLAEYPRAFQQFRIGNDLQKSDQSDRGIRYDSEETERYAARVKAEFDAVLDGASQRDPAKQPIFILGMPRSGTTLVERILGGLDGVVTGGESDSLEFVASQYYWDIERRKVAPPRELEDTDWDSLASEYWRRILCAPCRRTDKMPHNFWHVGFICAMFPAAAVIYMRRDPRDVCLSIYSRTFSDAHRYATDLESLAHYFSVALQLMEHWKSIYSSRILQVSYEDLVAKPDEETQKIARHCGLEWNSQCLNFHERVEASYTFSEMQVREPLNTKGVAAWRRYEEQLEPLSNALVRHGLLPG